MDAEHENVLCRSFLRAEPEDKGKCERELLFPASLGDKRHLSPHQRERSGGQGRKYSAGCSSHLRLADCTSPRPPRFSNFTAPDPRGLLSLRHAMDLKRFRCLALQGGPPLFSRVRGQGSRLSADGASCQTKQINTRTQRTGGSGMSPLPALRSLLPS